MAVSVALALLFICLVWLWMWRRGVKNMKGLPPPLSDGFNPIFGHLPLFFKLRRGMETKSIPEGVIDACRGVKHPAVTLYPGPPSLFRPYIFVLDPEDCRRLAVSGITYSQFLFAMSTGTGGPTFTCFDTEKAKRRKRALGSALLTPSQIKNATQILHKHLTNAMNAGELAHNGGLIDNIMPFTTRIATRAILEYILGDDSFDNVGPDGKVDPKLNERVENINRHLEGWFDEFSHMLLWPFPAWLYPIFNPRQSRNLSHHTGWLRREWLMPLIQQRKKMIENDELVAEDALTALLGGGNSKHSEALHPEQAITEVLGLVLAADATSGTLPWIIFHLANNPEIQEKVTDEVLSVLGSTVEPDHPDLEDLRAMPYLDAVIKECNRVTPLGRIIFRQAPEETNVGEYTIPKGFDYQLVTHDKQTSEDCFEQCDKLIPDRWLENPATGNAKVEGLTYAPFGYGKKRCFGQALARTLLKVFISLLVQTYTIKGVSLDQRGKLVGLIHCPREMVIRFIPRHGAAA